MCTDQVGESTKDGVHTPITTVGQEPEQAEDRSDLQDRQNECDQNGRIRSFDLPQLKSACACQQDHKTLTWQLVKAFCEPRTTAEPRLGYLWLRTSGCLLNRTPKPPWNHFEQNPGTTLRIDWFLQVAFWTTLGPLGRSTATSGHLSAGVRPNTH